jgi:hypothetical protein
MRVFRIILVIGLVVCFIIGFLSFLPNLLNPQYFGLRHKNAKWYADFTAACDSVLAEYPPGTNEVIWIPVTDPSLPKIIRDLHPLKLQVNPQRVWMLMGSDSHAGFGLEWAPKWGDTNVWILQTIAESMETVLYSAQRSVPPDPRGGANGTRPFGTETNRTPAAVASRRSP